MECEIHTNNIFNVDCFGTMLSKQNPSKSPFTRTIFCFLLVLRLCG